MDTEVDKGTRCPHCAFWNDFEASGKAIPDGPVYCNACGKVYGKPEVDPVALLESSRIVWRRDWDAIAVGFVLGMVAELVAGVVRDGLAYAWQAVW